MITQGSTIAPHYLRKTQAEHATQQHQNTIQKNKNKNDDTTEKNISQILCLCLTEHSRQKIRAISVRAQGFELSPPSPWDSSYPSNAPSDIDALQDEARKPLADGDSQWVGGPSDAIDTEEDEERVDIVEGEGSRQCRRAICAAFSAERPHP